MVRELTGHSVDDSGVIIEWTLGVAELERCRS